MSTSATPIAPPMPQTTRGLSVELQPDAPAPCTGRYAQPDPAGALGDVDASMMVMTPMPPTSSEIAATAPSIRV